MGCLDFGRQYLNGDIAEILVFSAVDDFQRASVEEYLNAKYFQPDPPKLMPSVLDHFALQSNEHPVQM